MVKLSQRLKHLADMVKEGAILADVGTDHGYIPIYLFQTGKIRRAYALDIKQGPLQRAKEHVEACGLGDYITLRLSDGVLALEPKEADSVLIAGMGGKVMLHILQEGEEVIRQAQELILQPQSEINKVREYLYQRGYVIDREEIVFEDGKYYPMMHVVFHEKEKTAYSELEWQILYRYGERAIKAPDETLCRYLWHKRGQYEQILANLKKEHRKAAVIRKKEVERELFYVNSALEYQKEDL